MKIKVRTHPIEVWYLTDRDARRVRYENGQDGSARPCFVTVSFGGDGLVWDTAEEFESDYQDTFGYSVSGFGELSYASEMIMTTALAKVARLTEKGGK